MRTAVFPSLVFAFLFICAAAPVGEAGQVPTAAITQAELDAYLAVIPQIDEVGDDPMGIFNLYRQSGISPERFSIISFRVSVGSALAQGVKAEQLGLSQAPAEMMPSDAEVDLIKRNMTNIQNAMGMER